MPKKKTTGVFNKAAQQSAVEGMDQSDGWRQLLQLVDVEAKEIIKEIPHDLIVQEAAFFRVALRLRNDEISREKKQGKQKSMEAVMKRKQTSQKYFDEAVANLEKKGKKVKPDTVAQELKKINGEYLQKFANPDDPTIKQIYTPKTTRLSKVFITNGFIKEACEIYNTNFEASKLAEQILESF